MPARDSLTTASVLVGAAGVTLGGLTVLADVPSAAWWLSSLWLLWRLLALDRTLAHRRAWRQNRTWTLTPAALVQQSADGPLLGQGFRWTAQHTQVLETALAHVSESKQAALTHA